MTFRGAFLGARLMYPDWALCKVGYRRHSQMLYVVLGGQQFFIVNRLFDQAAGVAQSHRALYLRFC